MRTRGAHLARRVVRRGAHVPLILRKVAPAGRAGRADADAVPGRAVAVAAVVVVLVAADVADAVADTRGVTVGCDETLVWLIALPVAVAEAVERVEAARLDVACLVALAVALPPPAPPPVAVKIGPYFGIRARSIDPRSWTRCTCSCPGNSLRTRRRLDDEQRMNRPR